MYRGFFPSKIVCRLFVRRNGNLCVGRYPVQIKKKYRVKRISQFQLNDLYIRIFEVCDFRGMVSTCIFEKKNFFHCLCFKKHISLRLQCVISDSTTGTDSEKVYSHQLACHLLEIINVRIVLPIKVYCYSRFAKTGFSLEM